MPVREAPIRAELDVELLSRPSLAVKPPARVYHQAFLTGDTSAPFANIAALLTSLDCSADDPDARQIVQNLDGGVLKWERHGEFVTLTVVDYVASDRMASDSTQTDDGRGTDGAQGTTSEGLWGQRIAPLLADSDFGDRIAACQIDVWPMMHMVKSGGDPEASAGSRLIGDDAIVFASYPPNADGFTTMRLYVNPMGKARCGRLIQRLLEIETYRYMGLMGFPLARAVQRDLHQLNADLNSHVAAMDVDADHSSNQSMLNDIQRLLQKTAALRARTDFRFAATRAYHAIFLKRLQEVREDRLDSFSRLSTFLNRRMQPAIDLCAAVARQQATLENRLSQMAQILRTRVEIGLAQQNQTVLAQLKSNGDMQVKLQRSVEGFSVVAISYYLVSLIAIFLKGGEKAGWLSGWEIYEALLAPVAIIIVLLRLRSVIRAHGAGGG